MKGILEYIEQYSDVAFDKKPFGNVDGLILSQFAYLKFDSIVPKVGEESADILLKDLQLCDAYEDLFADERYAKNNRELYELMANSLRFGSIRLNHYINLVSRKWELQFSAITCTLSDGETIVVYRGTDESVVGWKEDFNMAYMTPIPSQIKAVDYLNYVSERIAGDFSVCGHSKGGNLAVYAAMKCPESIGKRITSIYSYDGPGFTRKALSEGEYSLVRDRIRKFVPKSSIVGMLLQSQEHYNTVESKKIGILQHDPFNWVVDEDDFVYVKDIDNIAAIHKKTIDEWTDNIGDDEMRDFINQLYEVIDSVGINDLNDFRGNYADILIRFTRALDSIDDKHKELVKTIFKSLIDSFIETVKHQAGIS